MGIGILLVVVILLAGRFTQSSNARDLLFENPELEKCSSMDDEFLRDECYRKFARENRNPDVCKIISREIGKSECLRDIALESGNSTLCRDIQDIARRDSCYYTIALDKNNAEDCSNIAMESSRYRCMGIIERDTSNCDLIKNETARDWCIFYVFQRDPQAEICHRINSIRIRDQCLLKYVEYDNLASPVCKDIRDTELRKKCEEIGIKLTCPLEKAILLKK